MWICEEKLKYNLVVTWYLNSYKVMLLLPHLFESIGFVDNFGAAGSKVLVTELREDSGPRLDVDSEALHARGVTPQLRPVIKYDDCVSHIIC